MRLRGETKDEVPVMLMRGLGIISFLVIPPFKYVLTQGFVDPLWLRMTLGLISLTLVVASYYSSWIRRNTRLVSFSYGFLLVAWMLSLTLINRLEPTFVASYIVILFAIIVMIRDWKWLLGFGMMNIVPLAAAFFIKDPLFSPVAFTGMVTSVLSVGSMGYWSSFAEVMLARTQGEELQSLSDAALEASNEGILVTNTTGKVREHNGVLLRLWAPGLDSLHDMEAQEWMSVLQKRLQEPELVSNWVQTATTTSTNELIAHFQLHDGRYLRMLSKPVGGEKKLYGRIWFFKDVTAGELRKAAMQEREEQLKRKNEALLTLSSDPLLQAADLETMGKQVTVQIAAALSADLVSVMALGANGDELQCKGYYDARIGITLQGGTITRSKRPDLFQGLALERFLVHRGGILQGTDVKPDDYAHVVIVPLRLRGKPFATLSAERRPEHGHFTTEEVQFLASVGDMLSLSLEANERNKAETGLAQSAALLHSVYELGGIGILVTGMDRKVIDLNSTYLSMFNMDREFAMYGDPDEVIGYCQEQLMDKARISSSMRFILDNPAESDFARLLFKDGRILERFTELLQADGKPIGRIWYYRDETKRLMAEQKLVDSEMRNQAILTAIPDLMIRMNGAGDILDRKVPDGAEKHFGPHLKDANRIQEIFPAELAQFILQQANVSLDNRTVCEESAEMEIEGQVRHLEVRFAPSGTSEVLLMLRDVTARRKTERELVQRNHELDSFVYRASHDLKAPLNSLMGLIELMKAGTTNPAQVQYLQLMDRSVVKLDTFIRNLTDFSRISRSTIYGQEVSFQGLIEEVTEGLRYMQNADRVERRIHIPEDLRFVGDNFHLSIVLSNLLSNALKYCDTQKPTSWVEVNIVPNGSGCSITVSDNGVGIPAEHQARIFELFFRASNKSFGSGIGLYITRNAVEKMGGQIQMRSEEGQGTSFTVLLPSLQAETKTAIAAY